MGCNQIIVKIPDAGMTERKLCIYYTWSSNLISAQNSKRFLCLSYCNYCTPLHTTLTSDPEWTGRATGVIAATAAATTAAGGGCLIITSSVTAPTSVITSVGRGVYYF